MVAQQVDIAIVPESFNCFLYFIVSVFKSGFLYQPQLAQTKPVLCDINHYKPYWRN